MKRTKILFAAAGSWLLLSCAPDVVSIQVKNAIGGQPDEKCNVSEDSSTQRGGGFVDVGYTGSYHLALWLTSALDNSAIQAGGVDVQPGSRNDFYLRKLKLEYAGKGVPSIPPQAVPAGGTVQAGGNLFLGLNVLTADAVTRLQGAVIPPGGLRFEVSISFEGEFAHGSTMETAPFVFPLTVANNTPVVCNANQKMEPIGGVMPACGNYGQDGIYPECVCREDTPCGVGCDGGEGPALVCDQATCNCVAAQ